MKLNNIVNYGSFVNAIADGMENRGLNPAREFLFILPYILDVFSDPGWNFFLPW
jgi:hypothetical protein